MKWLKRILIALAILFAVALALPFLIPLNTYLPRIEAAAAARLKQPVSIQNLRFSALPLPHITADGIAVGAADDIRVSKVSVTPHLSSLLQATKIIKTIEIDSLTLSQQALGMIPVWVKSAPPSADPPFRVESIRLNNALVNFGKARLGPFDARIALGSTGEPDDATISMQDSTLQIGLKRDVANNSTHVVSSYLIDAAAKSWIVPLGLHLVIDELHVKGIATRSDCTLDQINASLYGGTVSGKAVVRWKKGAQLNGQFKIDQVEMQKIATMLPSKTRISGKLSAQPTLSSTTTSADQLIDALHLETQFNVQNGVLYGIDIQKAATSLVKQGSSGGETRFDHLSGHLVMARGAYRFTQLKISSGALAVSGHVDISAKKVLTGRIDAQVKLLGASASVPLNVSGTLDEPVLFPTGGVIAGAAVGTTILGPGVGTSVGAKIGGWVEGLFGQKEKKGK